MPAQQISILFCQHFDCPLPEYEPRMLSESLYWHARLLAPLVRALMPDFFADDLRFIRQLGASTEPREVTVDVLNFHDTNRAKANFWRTTLKIRASGRKAGNRANMLLSNQHQPGSSGVIATILSDRQTL